MKPPSLPDTRKLTVSFPQMAAVPDILVYHGGGLLFRYWSLLYYYWSSKWFFDFGNEFDTPFRDRKSDAQHWSVCFSICLPRTPKWNGWRYYKINMSAVRHRANKKCHLGIHDFSFDRIQALISSFLAYWYLSLSSSRMLIERNVSCLSAFSDALLPSSTQVMVFSFFWLVFKFSRWSIGVVI